MDGAMHLKRTCSRSKEGSKETGMGNRRLEDHLEGNCRVLDGPCRIAAFDDLR